MTRKLVTPAEVEAITGIPVGTLAQWRYKKIGPKFYKLGRHCRYDENELLAWIDENAQEAA